MKILIGELDRRFADLHQRRLDLLKQISENALFRRTSGNEEKLFGDSSGEYLLRSMAVVEQTCGGIMTRLWDDPFEWTLPEHLSTKKKVAEYFDEVEQTRRKAFQLFQSDDDLSRQIPAPETLKSIHSLLSETLSRSENLLGSAQAAAHLAISI
jgi:hypothetical protein